MRSTRTLGLALAVAALLPGLARAEPIAWRPRAADPALLEDLEGTPPAAATRAVSPAGADVGAEDLRDDDALAPLEADLAPRRARRRGGRRDPTPASALILLGTGLLVAVSEARKRRAIALVA
jgi:hypothetical protein